DAIDDVGHIRNRSSVDDRPSGTASAGIPEESGGAANTLHHTGCKLHELRESARVQRKIDDLFGESRLADLRRCGLNGRSRCGDADLFGDGAELEREIGLQTLAHAEREVHRLLAKALVPDDDRVAARLQREGIELTAGGGYYLALHIGGETANL